MLQWHEKEQLLHALLQSQNNNGLSICSYTQKLKKIKNKKKILSNLPNYEKLDKFQIESKSSKLITLDSLE